MPKTKVEIPEGYVKQGGYKELISSLEEVGGISIRPFLNGRDRMGLDKYGLVLFPHTKQTEELTCLEFNGTKRYVSGLDEFSPEILRMKDENERNIKVKTIREVVSYLEKVLAANNVDPEDKDFWDKVKQVRPDNLKFWSNVKLTLSNQEIDLNPKTEPKDLILYMAIEAGGFPSVAPSLEAAKSSPNDYRFYLDKRIVTATGRASIKKLRNKAISMLDSLYDTNFEKMLYLAKVLDMGSSNYKRSTSRDIIYDFLDDYISGNLFEKDKTKSAQDFINYFALDMETLKLKAIIKDAIYFRIIVPKPDGMLYHMTTNSALGKNNDDVLSYLKNITNEDIMRLIMKETEKNW